MLKDPYGSFLKQDFRPRSPVCDTSQAESLNRMQSKDCSSNHFATLSAKKHKPEIVEQKSNLVSSLRLKMVRYRI